MSWKRLWKNLPLDLRAEAIDALIEHLEGVGDAQALAVVHLAIERGCKTPRKKFEKQPRERRAALAAKAQTLDADVIALAMRYLHIVRRTELLCGFLDRLGLEHKNGSVDEFPAEPVAVALLVRAMRRLLHEHSIARCELYWDVLELMGQDYWQNLAAGRALLITSAAEMVADPPPPPPPEKPPPRSVRVSFTPLDQAVIDAIVASVGSTAGALSPAAVRRLVEELVSLNAKRFVSYHHLGFLDAMQSAGETVEAEFPEVNESRREWYLAGAVAAYARRADHARVIELFDKYRFDFDQFGRAIHPATQYVVGPLFEALRKGGRVVEAAQLLHPPAVALAWDSVHAPLLGEIVGFLRQQKVDEAEPLLDLLDAAMDLEESFRGEPIEEELRAAVQRRRAHCLRLRRKWGEADALLARIAGENDGMLLADRGLVACHTRSLADVSLPSDLEMRASCASSLEPGRRWFVASTRAKTRRGHGDYCLGVLHLARDEVDEARPHLRRAVAEMSMAPIYRELGILGRANLYLAYAESCLLDAARAPAALAALGVGFEERVTEVPDLVRKTIENLALAAPQRTRAFLAEWQPVLGEDLLDIACQSQFLRDAPELRELVQQRAARTTRSAKQQFTDHEALLEAAIATGDEEFAVDELDALEALADELPQRFLALIENAERRGTLWDVDDVALARARVLRGLGKLSEAAACLRAVAFRILRDESQDGPRQAEELLELIASFGGEPEEQLTAAVRRALTQGEGGAAPIVREESPARGKILFVGGQETQARYDAEVRKRVGERFPSVELVLKHPGWESTWMRQLKRMEHDVQTCHAIVIMRFVRTQLGRTLRRRCNERGIRWYACTGHGLDSICRAIDAAATGLRGVKPAPD